MAISTKSFNALVDSTKDKLENNFNFSINIDGFDKLAEELDLVLDVDYDSLRQLNKETLFWYEYLSDLESMTEIYLDRFKNTLEIYTYLQFLTKKDKNEFLRLAPKYKISTRVFDDAVMELTKRKSDMELFVRNLKNIVKFLESYKRYTLFHYFRTSRLIRTSFKRFKNAGD